MSIFEKWRKDPEYARGLAQETLILDVTEDLLGEMIGLGINRVQLAEKLGKPKSQISQLFSGSRNMTLRTLSDICWALGLAPKVRVVRVEKLKAMESHPLTTEGAAEMKNVYHFKNRTPEPAANGGLAA